MNPFPSQERSSFSFFFFTLCSGLFLVSGITLILTNPSSIKYEQFATEELVRYAKENVCSPKSSNLEEAIKSQVCNLMIHTGRKQVPKLIRETSQRRNYLLLSIYETDLFLYKFETIGVFNHFYIINVRKVYD